jgi:hypothetical protein
MKEIFKALLPIISRANIIRLDAEPSLSSGGPSVAVRCKRICILRKRRCFVGAKQ